MKRYHNTSAGVWLKIAKKGSRRAGITIDEARDTALCYGWIDSQRKGLDREYFLQRYSPRRGSSPWSKLNADRARALVAMGRMTPAGHAEIDAAKVDGRWKSAYAPQRDVRLPADFVAALGRNNAARRSFGVLSKTDRYAIILPILKATSPGRRTASVEKALAMLLRKANTKRHRSRNGILPEKRRQRS